MAQEAQKQPVDDTGATTGLRHAGAGTHKCVSIMLTRMAAELQEAALIYNQSGSKMIEVTSPMRVAEGETLKLILSGAGYAFVNDNSDRIQIFEISGDTTSLYAELHPTTDGHGDLVGWIEKQIYAGGILMDRTLNALTNSYFIATVLKGLQLKSSSGPSQKKS